jgi:OOP family OmpA-OmpF porin
MKLFLACWIYFLLILCSVSGQTNRYIKDPAIGIHFFTDQFPRPAGNSGDLRKGLAISYLQGLSSHLDLSIGLAATFLDYQLPDGSYLGHGSLLLEWDAAVMAKLLSDRHFFTPYLLAGAGVSGYGNYYGVFTPLGAGVQLNFSNKAYLLLDAEYRAALTSRAAGHYYYSLGLAGNIITKKRKNIRPAPAVPAGKPVSSKDSVVRAPADTDGDGIPDSEDKCPTVAGTLKYHGCPIPDTDGDGIDDEHDSCPTVPGLAKYHGCPEPRDSTDSSQRQRATGIIRIKLAEDARNIFFRSDSYEILPPSWPALDDVAAMLNKAPDLRLLIEGHTDASGDSAWNQTLSERRAAAVWQYLVTKGKVAGARLTYRGFGPSRPVATNETPQGRALNRRVELNLRTQP